MSETEARPVVDADALAKIKAEVLDRVGMFTTSSGREAPAKDLPMVRQLVEQVVDIMIDIGEASVQDAADVRRGVAEERDRLAAIVARVRALCNGPATHPQAPLYVRISAVLAILNEQGDIDLPEQARRLASQAWAEGYADGIHDWQKSLDHDGGQTPPARVNPYIAREAGEKP